MALETVKVINTLYLPQNDVVMWDVETAQGKKHTLFWRRQDFGPGFNVQADLPAKIVMEFNDKMVGKEVKVDLEGGGPVPQELLVWSKQKHESDQ